MSALADYTQDETDKLMAAPMVVSMYIMGSSLSGPIGLVKEMMAGVETALNAAKQSAPDSVIGALFSEENMKLQESKMQEEARESTVGAANMDQAKKKMLEELKQAVTIITAKGSAQEQAAYKKLMVDVADNVAHAATEGGFLGLGSTLVNDAEKTAIVEIQNAIN